jgi:hypothetical protein
MRYELAVTTYLPGQANAAAKAAAEAGQTTGLSGYWITEIGTLNQTVELWSGHRPAPAGEALERTSWTLTAVRGPAPPDASGGIYEMRHYRLRPGTAAAWSEIFAAALPAREQHSRITGLFVSDPGEEDRVVHIWNYPDLNTRTSARAAAMQDPVWLDFLAKSRAQKYTVRQEVSILLPMPHSPLR